MKKLIAGNWKMNGMLEGACALACAIKDGLAEKPALLDTCDFAVFPPFVHIAPVRECLKDIGVVVGGQDCSEHENGAFTGDVSAEMLKDIGCEYVILGHSERRQYYDEVDLEIADKAALAHAAGLKTIICVGEDEDERENKIQKAIVEIQLAEALPGSATAENTVIAYEPVWAIGTGKSATPDDVEVMHSFIRHKLKRKVENPLDVPILYGGSVKPGNAAELFKVPNVDGALIGGASLTAADFLSIAEAV